MAIDTGNRTVRTFQRELSLIMVKCIVFTPRWMAGKAGRTAVRIPVYAIVMVVCFRIGMAGDTGKFCIIRWVGMAVGTLIPLPFVRTAVYGEIVDVVLCVFRRHPVQIRGMAFYTIL